MNAMAKHHVAEFVSRHGGKAGFVRRHVDQAAAENDRVADDESLRVEVVETRQRTSGSKSILFVTSRVLSTVSRTLFGVPLGGHQADALKAIVMLSSVDGPRTAEPELGEIVVGLVIVADSSLDRIF